MQADAVDESVLDSVNMAEVYSNGHTEGEAGVRRGISKTCTPGMGDPDSEADSIKQPLLHEAANGHAEAIVDAGMAPERRAGT